MSRRYMLLLPLLVLVAACSEVPLPSKAPAFDQIRVGKTTRAEVFAAMGHTPQRRTLHNVAGLEIESVQYEDFCYIYEIKVAATPFTEATVLSKSLVPKNQPAEQ